MNLTGYQAIMTVLFRRIKPTENFRITKRQIAKFLKIAESLIAKVESWAYVLFIHRRDRGGYFISYRQLENWKNAVACQMQKCSNWQELQQLWSAIIQDHSKHKKQYDNAVVLFLKQIENKCRKTIQQKSRLDSYFITHPA